VLALDQVGYGFVGLRPHNAQVLVAQCREINFNRFVSKNVFFEMEGKNGRPQVAADRQRVQER